jgi:CheY-like chemotaxis protein
MAEVRSIVMVDDDADDQDFFRSACSVVDPSLEVTCYQDSEKALEKISALPQPPDLIFLDLNMPRFNGVEFLEKLKKEPLMKRIPVVIYSTFCDLKVRQVCTMLGAIAVIQKPDNFNLLCQTLLNILKK